MADVAKLSLFIACAYLLIVGCARRSRPQWTEHLMQRRLAVLGILTLAVTGIKLIEDVVAKESGPVDEAILWFVRDHVPAVLNGFFAVVTLSGSAKLLVPLAAVAAAALLVAGRRFEALLVGALMITATLVVWGMKAIVGRARPALWEAQWYLGVKLPQWPHPQHCSVFHRCRVVRGADLAPRRDSGDGACCAVDRPGCDLSSGAWCPLAVGLLAAMCLGAFIPLLISVANDLCHRSSGGEEPPF